MGSALNIALKVLANPAVTKIVGGVFDRVLGGGKESPTKDKVSAPATAGLIVSAILVVAKAVDPGLAEILEAGGINGLVLGAYSLSLSVLAYYQRETK